MTTRERILEAAGRLFSEQGFDGTSTRQVGAAAEANIGTIAYHFGGKEGLYNAVLARMYERVLELRLPEDLSGPPEARVRAVMAAVWAFCRSERPAVRLLLRHVLERGSLPVTVRDQWGALALARAIEIQTALGIEDLADRRLALLSLNHLLARYCVSSAQDLEPFIEGEWEEAVARHLGDVAVALLL
jgi:AcrR family transcriptional regulator